MELNEKNCPYCGETIKAIALLCKHCKSDLRNSDPAVAINKDNVDFNEEIIKSDAPLPDDHANQSGGLIYSGFWRRAVASIVDGVIIGLPLYAIQLQFFSSEFSSLNSIDAILSLYKSSKFLLTCFFCLMLSAAYSIFFWNLYGATPGKLLVGVKIVSINNKKLPFFNLYIRWLMSIIDSFLIFGFLIQPITKNKQTLHDLVAKTYVIQSKNISSLILWTIGVVSLIVYFTIQGFLTSYFIGTLIISGNTNSQDEISTNEQVTNPQDEISTNEQVTNPEKTLKKSSSIPTNDTISVPDTRSSLSEIDLRVFVVPLKKISLKVQSNSLDQDKENQKIFLKKISQEFNINDAKLLKHLDINNDGILDSLYQLSGDYCGSAGCTGVIFISESLYNFHYYEIPNFYNFVSSVNEAANKIKTLKLRVHGSHCLNDGASECFTYININKDIITIHSDIN
jgi:uncharacterized RDD family membrane protein YckC